MSFRLNVTADPEFRKELLTLVRENIKPVVTEIVASLLPATVSKMIEKYLEHAPVASWKNSPDAGKSRLALLFERIDGAVSKKVDEATNNLSKDIFKQFEANIASRMEYMLQHRIDAKLKDLMRESIREELSRAFKA